MTTVRTRFKTKICGMFGIDLRAVAIFRMACGWSLMCDILARFPEIVSHYTSEGVVPAAIRRSEMLDTGEMWGWSVYFVSDSIGFVAFLFSLTVLVGFSLSIGFYSRISCIIGWILYYSVLVRMPYVMDGGNLILKQFLFFGAFLPLGARFSIDAKLNQRLNLPLTQCSAATVAILAQITIIYFMSALWKWGPSWRETGDALHEALSVRSLTTDLAEIARQYPEHLKIATQGVLFVEEVVPLIALLIPVSSWWRAIPAAVMIMFHILISVFFTLGLFPLIAASGWLLFLPTPLLDRIFSPAECNDDLMDFDCHKVVKRYLTPPYTSPVVLGCLTFVIAWNAVTLPGVSPSDGFSRAMGRIATLSGLSQNWGFFAPNVLTRDGWYVSSVLLRDGKVVDICRSDPIPPSFSKVSSVPDMYLSKNWRQFLVHSFHFRRARLIQGYCNWLCESWNRSNPENPVVKCELFFMLEDSNYPRKGVQRIQVFPVKEVNKGGLAVFSEWGALEKMERNE